MIQFTQEQSPHLPDTAFLKTTPRFLKAPKSDRFDRELIDAVPQMFIISDTTGTILAINQKALEKLDCREEILGEPISQIFHFEDREKLLSLFAEINEKNSRQAASHLRMVGKNGNLISVAANIRVSCRKNGKKFFFVVCEDVTEYQTLQEALRESENRRQVIFNNAEIILWETDKNGIYTFSEGSNIKLANLNPPEAVGLSAYQVHKNNPQIIKNLNLTLTGKTYSEPVLIDNIWFHSSGAPLIDKEGRIIGARGIIVSISSQIKAEQKAAAALRQLETLTALTSSVTNDAETDVLLKNLADIIVETTRFKTCVVMEFTDENPSQQRFRSFSKNFSPAVAEIFPRFPYQPEMFRKIIAEGEVLEVGNLGYTVYQKDKPNSAFCRMVKRMESIIKGKGIVISKTLWEGDSVIVPIIAPEDNFFGAIFLQDNGNASEKPKREDVSSVVALARQLSQIFAHQRATRKLSEKIKREEAINRVTNVIRQSLDLKEIFQNAVSEIGKYLQVDRCCLFLKDEKKQILRHVAEYNQTEIPTFNKDLPLTVLEMVDAEFLQKGFWALGNTDEHEGLTNLFRELGEEKTARSTLYVPIEVEGNFMGGFSVANLRILRKWTEDDISFVRGIAGQTGIAIRQAELFEQTRSRSLRESLINKLSLAIRSSLHFSTILKTATHELGKTLGVSRCYVRLVNENPNILPGASFEYRKPNVPPVTPKVVSLSSKAGIIYRRLGALYEKTGQNVIIHDISTHQSEYAEINDYCRLHADLGDVKSCMYFPLTVGGRLLGSLCLQQTDQVRNWTSDEVELVKAVADRLSIAISHAELFEGARKAKLEWESTFAAMTDGVFIFDRQGFLKRVNAAGAELEKCSPSELIGRKCCQILPSATHTPANCMIEKVLRMRKPLTVEFVPLNLKRPVLVTSEPILDETGEISGVVCTVRDLFELRQAEAVARERQSLLTHILEGIREPVFAVDLSGKITWTNSSLTEVTGFLPDEIIGRSIFDLIPPDFLEGTRRTIKEAIAGRPKTAEARYFNRKGEMRYAVFDSVPLIADGKSTGILMFARDITEQKLERRRIAEADKLRALGQLASGVAHDFNNTLATILGRIQILQTRMPGEDSLRSLKIMEKAAEDAADVVRKIQTFARKSSVTNFETLNLTALLQDSIEFTQTRWEAEAKIRGYNYAVILENKEPFFIKGIASELREVFVNLILNGIDAMPNGGDIRISSRKEDNRVIVSFTDNGIGMSEEVRKRIFEPFFSTKGINGTGLGLSITYNIIKEHNGEITVFSTPQKGTRFEISLPLTESFVSANEKNEELKNMTSYEVLVVDDDDLVRETLVEILEIMSHRVVSATSGAEALQILEKQSFDLVLTDFSMRGMSGKDVAQAIRERHNNTKIILVSGYGDSIAPGEVPEVDFILTKPVNFQKLQTTIEKVMAN